MKLTTYISTMLQKDLHSPILVLGGGQVQRCPNIIHWFQINTLGQQQSYSFALPWRHTMPQLNTTRYLDQDTQVMFSKPSLNLRNAPYSAASCSGVERLQSVTSGSPPRSRRYPRTLSLPPVAALWTGDRPTKERISLIASGTSYKRGKSHSELVARTFLGGGVDIEPQFLHQEPANLQMSLHRGEVEGVPPLGVLGFPQVHLARHLYQDKLK